MNCFKTDEVVVLAKGLSEFKVLLSEGDGLSTRPQTIAYSAVDHQLIVSYNLLSVVESVIVLN